LERILDLADSSPDREAWFGTHKPGTDWDGPGICILFAAATPEAIIAEVIDRSTKAPDEPATRELYQDRGEFAAWWHIRNPIRVEFESLNKIPGCHWKSRLGAAKVFKSQVSFTYWDFGGEFFEDLASAGVVGLHVPQSAMPIGAAPEETSWATDPGSEGWPRPECPIYGVDFSGGQEDRRGNRKIWVATWLPGKNVALRCGWTDNTAERICRRDLPGLIDREPAGGR
jgi:hypothetical protein